ncbi:acyl-CoA/acyl-ACP dehydrogenase [Ornithinimicrobium sp. F0845]|uniref:acyl-CoA dehydrogenase family protein n=1 Tax=Ornithinimicrobium sp. F0845 TaxID=2926412 RepID=UPI001FF4F22C|nr:acyl-CoA dehydrogenase family protein [Ornithinimicrobium sp. F0845]MCK0112024.1 acyl-CoA/acyl-ACP dehydrogenase [Ornithinimicrobium sp. F0845]
MTSQDVDPSFAPLMAQFFREQSPPERVSAAEQQDLDESLWAQVTEMGLPLIGIDETLGGSGGSLAELLVVLEAAGRASAPVPLAETATASWALAHTGAHVSGDLLTVAPGDPRDTLTVTDGVATGVVHGVPWARVATHTVTVVASGQGPVLVAIPLASATVRAGYDLARQPKDMVSIDAVPVAVSPWPGTPNELTARLTLLRGALMAGALEEVADLTRQYVSERVQFGRPVGRFQAVQEHVVRLEQQATLALLAVNRAAAAAEVNPSALEVKLMKLATNEGARLAVRAAHQAHGAIGMTQEYRLQLLTRRLNSWLGEAGTSSTLASEIGAVATERGIAPLITSSAGTMEQA